VSGPDPLALLAARLDEPREGRPLGGEAWRVRVGDRLLVAKGGPGTLDEAEGLRALAAVPGGPPVPTVVLAEPGLLVTAFVPEGPRTPAAEEALGRALAELHGTSSPWGRFGGGSAWIGRCPVDPWSALTDEVGFYRARLAELAARCGLAGAVAPLLERLEELLPDGPARLVHGDLWWGNVRFGADGRAWLLDPSAHGGDPEEDLAMLGLFGPVPRRLLAAYEEVRPLPAGSEDRLALFRLVPLLVHAALFDGPYRAEALAVIRRYVGRSAP
jgi:fructosamine-3-kinase